MKMFWIALAVSLTASFVSQPSDAKATKRFSPILEPFQCDNTPSMNVAKYVSTHDGTIPLLLETVTQGDTCGFEGGQITNIAGVQINEIMLEIAGTSNATGFGPYLQIFYNGNQVNTLPISQGRIYHNYGVMGIMREWNTQELGLPAGAEISAVRIIANPFAAGDGKCMIRQLHVNGALFTPDMPVTTACP